MFKKTMFGFVVLSLLGQVIFLISSDAPMFSLVHIVASVISLVMSFGVAFTIILPLLIENELDKNIRAVVGNYKPVKRWGNLALNYGRDGEMLLLTNDNKLVKVRVAKLKIVEQFQVKFETEMPFAL